MYCILTEYRKENGLTNCDLAKMLNVKVGTLQYWVSTGFIPHTKHRSVAKQLSIPVYQIVYEWEKRNGKENKK